MGTDALNSRMVSLAEYIEFLQYKACKQTSSEIASVVQTGNSVTCFSQSSSSESWVIDSGASDHISGNKSLFTTISYSQSLPKVTMANGSQTMATAIGQASPLPSLPLDSVLYVPNSPFNLIAVSRLAKSLKCAVLFLDDHVFIQERSTGRIIGTGRESNGLYYLILAKSHGLTSCLPSTTCPVTDSPDLLHKRLGHPSLSKLQKMVSGLSHLSALECESCQLGKHTRSHFPRRLDNRAESPFTLVHSDVWGPSRVSSTLGFRYFVSFIDDYSRCTWIFLIKNRSELFSIFQTFHAEIQNQFGVSIRTFRSDNAREYLSSPFQQFMKSHGIIHQTSCPYTSQQNGVAERKNRHLIETARTLLIQSHAPLRFWGMQFLHLAILLIVCHLQLSRTKFHSLSCFPTYLCSLFHPVSLEALVLSITLLQEQIS